MKCSSLFVQFFSLYLFLVANSLLKNSSSCISYCCLCRSTLENPSVSTPPYTTTALREREMEQCMCSDGNRSCSVLFLLHQLFGGISIPFSPDHDLSNSGPSFFIYLLTMQNRSGQIRSYIWKLHAIDSLKIKYLVLTALHANTIIHNGPGQAEVKVAKTHFLYLLCCCSFSL